MFCRGNILRCTKSAQNKTRISQWRLLGTTTEKEEKIVKRERERAKVNERDRQTDTVKDRDRNSKGVKDRDIERSKQTCNSGRERVRAKMKERFTQTDTKRQTQ